VLAPDGAVEKIRPNQIFAVSLPFDLLDNDRRRDVLRVVSQELLTSVGLRTLAPGDPDYKGRYQGSPVERDGAYHQGTVWPWLLGPYVDAVAIAYGREAAVEFVATRIDHSLTAEVFDGDEPRRAGGCPFQAWTVAELRRLRADYLSGSK
jgi:glycogen debranching enzyme